MPGIHNEIVEITPENAMLEIQGRAALTCELTYVAAPSDERAGGNVAVVMQAAPSANAAATMKEAT